MSDFNIRITRRTEVDNCAHEESIDIDFGKALVGNSDVADFQKGERMAARVGALAALIEQHALPALEWSDTLCAGERVNHAKAIEACTALGEGWRLPTRVELLSLVDDTRHEPAIDTDRFPDTKSGAYWTSTLCAWASSGAWIVSFGYGDANYYHRDNGFAFVRAVRAVPAGQ